MESSGCSHSAALSSHSKTECWKNDEDTTCSSMRKTIRLEMPLCKPIVLLEMSKALRWLLMYISNNIASANEGWSSWKLHLIALSFVPSMTTTSCATVASQRHCSFMRKHNIQNMCCRCQTLYPCNVEFLCCRCGVPHLLLPSPSLLQKLWNNEWASDVTCKWLSPW